MNVYRGLFVKKLEGKDKFFMRNIYSLVDNIVYRDDDKLIV